jgi:hypothetical protein
VPPHEPRRHAHGWPRACTPDSRSRARNNNSSRLLVRLKRVCVCVCIQREQAGVSALFAVAGRQPPCSESQRLVQCAVGAQRECLSVVAGMMPEHGEGVPWQPWYAPALWVQRCAPRHISATFTTAHNSTDDLEKAVCVCVERARVESNMKKNTLIAPGVAVLGIASPRTAQPPHPTRPRWKADSHEPGIRTCERSHFASWCTQQAPSPGCLNEEWRASNNEQ